MPEYKYDILPEYIGGFGRVTSSSIVKIFQRAATRHSDELGYTGSWYRDEEVAWVARKHRIQRIKPIPLEPPLTVRTQIEDFRRVRSLRSYELQNHSDDLLVRGFTDWVYVQRENGRPSRIPDELAESFNPSTSDESPHRKELSSPQTIEEEPVHTSVVRFSDVDNLGHANNAIYLDYLLEGILREDRENNNTPLIQRENPLLLTELSIKYMTQSRWKDEIACRLRSSDEGERIQNYEFILEHEQGRVAEGTFSLKDQ